MEIGQTHLTPEAKDCEYCTKTNKDDEFTLNKYGDNYCRDYNHIYVLGLENDKWYVGRTQYICTRLRDHFIGEGAKWTKKYNPVFVHMVRTFNSDFTMNKVNQIENLFTLFFMKEYGWRNVRGGKYCQLKLPSKYIKNVNYKIKQGIASTR